MFSLLQLLIVNLFHLRAKGFDIEAASDLLAPQDLFQLIELLNVANEGTNYILNTFLLLMKFSLKSYFRIRRDPMGWRQVGQADLNFLV